MGAMLLLVPKMSAQQPDGPQTSAATRGWPCSQVKYSSAQRDYRKNYGPRGNTAGCGAGEWHLDANEKPAIRFIYARRFLLPKIIAL